MLTIHLDRDTFEECRVHLAALAALRHSPVVRYRADIVGRLTLLLTSSAVRPLRRPDRCRGRLRPLAL